MLKIVSPPGAEPISSSELTSYLREDISSLSGEELGFIDGLITASREYCESYQRRSYVTQTLEVTFDEFPQKSQIITIPRGNLKKIDSFKYKDSLGVEHTLTEGSDFVCSTSGVLGRIAPINGWPSTDLYQLDPIVIQFTCGNDFESVPLRVKQAMYMLCAFWYDNRSAVLVGSISKELEFSVKALLGFDRIGVPDASGRT